MKRRSAADYASASISAARGDRRLEPVDTDTVSIADDDTVADQRDDAMDAVKNDDDTSSDGTNTGDDDSNDSGDSDTAAGQPRVLPLA